MSKDYEDSRDGAEELFRNLRADLEDLLKSAPRELCALECLANDPVFAKPDSKKIFILWEAKIYSMVWDGTRAIEGIRVDMIPQARLKHSALINLFFGRNVVRFPFNVSDGDLANSLSWVTVLEEFLADGWDSRLLRLPRWSTASRSCFSLIPKKPETLERIFDQRKLSVDRQRIDVQSSRIAYCYVNVPEWNSRYKDRYFQVQVGENRLYSVKTGVKFVGSRDESGSKKHRLEDNCFLAMARSKVIEDFAKKDPTFGIQTEVLTITAPCRSFAESEEGEDFRDGFQVRDLSCLRPSLDYMPCQAIPYARESFDSIESGETESQCHFWRKQFAIPLGRAKARLFLNFGLVHYSANAQNFILGFNGSKLEQFVARDLGDTSWHNRYLEKYFKLKVRDEVKPSARFRRLVHKTFCEEDKHPHAHTLWKPDGKGNYPPPRIMRLATNTLLTHDFAHMLREKHNWSMQQVYIFTTGVLDGFRKFIEEAFGWAASLYPSLSNSPDTNEVDGNIKQYGIDGKFPTVNLENSKQKYKDKVDQALSLSEKDLFRMAAQIRNRGNMLEDRDYENFQNGDDDGICTLINAEELLLCAGLESRLGTIGESEPKSDVATKIDELLSGNRQWPRVVPGEVKK